MLLGSETVDPHIFGNQDPDPGSQNLADPTDPDPDPKHWLNYVRLKSLALKGIVMKELLNNPIFIDLIGFEDRMK